MTTTAIVVGESPEDDTLDLATLTEDTYALKSLRHSLVAAKHGHKDHRADHIKSASTCFHEDTRQAYLDIAASEGAAAQFCRMAISAITKLVGDDYDG